MTVTYDDIGIYDERGYTYDGEVIGKRVGGDKERLHGAADSHLSGAADSSLSHGGDD